MYVYDYIIIGVAVAILVMVIGLLVYDYYQFKKDFNKKD